MSELSNQLLDVEEVIHGWCRPATFDDEGVVDVLEVRTNSDLVLLVVLVNHHLVSSYRRKVDVPLLVQLPPIKALSQFFWVKLLDDRLVRVFVISFSMFGGAVLV